MPQTMRLRPSTSPSGQQARLGYVPVRVVAGTGMEVSGAPSGVTIGITASGVTKGTYGDSTHVAQVTMNDSGQVTGAKNVAIAFPADTGITQLTGDVTAGPGSGSQAATLKNSGVTAAKYGSSTKVAQVTFDAQGRATVAADVPIAFPVGSVTFGTGVPGGTPASGDLYFDDTTSPVYVGYVGRSGSWFKF